MNPTNRIAKLGSMVLVVVTTLAVALGGLLLAPAAPVYAVTSTPTPPQNGARIDERLARLFEREQNWLEVQADNLGRANERPVRSGRPHGSASPQIPGASLTPCLAFSSGPLVTLERVGPAELASTLARVRGQRHGHCHLHPQCLPLRPGRVECRLAERGALRVERGAHRSQRALVVRAIDRRQDDAHACPLPLGKGQQTRRFLVLPIGRQRPTQELHDLTAGLWRKRG